MSTAGARRPAMGRRMKVAMPAAGHHRAGHGQEEISIHCFEDGEAIVAKINNSAMLKYRVAKQIRSAYSASMHT
jgi:hypothetical protein